MSCGLTIHLYLLFPRRPGSDGEVGEVHAFPGRLRADAGEIEFENEFVLTVEEESACTIDTMVR